MIDMGVLIGKVHEYVSLIPDYKYKCDWCNERVFYVPADQAYVMGHIYTEMGLREFEISETCEFCFDRMCL